MFEDVFEGGLVLTSPGMRRGDTEDEYILDEIQNRTEHAYRMWNSKRIFSSVL